MEREQKIVRFDSWKELDAQQDELAGVSPFSVAVELDNGIVFMGPRYFGGAEIAVDQIYIPGRGSHRMPEFAVNMIFKKDENITAVYFVPERYDLKPLEEILKLISEEHKHPPHREDDPKDHKVELKKNT